MRTQPELRGSREPPGGCADGDTAHSYPESRLHGAPSGGGKSWMGREGQGEGHPGESSRPISLSRLSLDFSFHPHVTQPGLSPWSPILAAASFRNLPDSSTPEKSSLSLIPVISGHL